MLTIWSKGHPTKVLKSLGTAFQYLADFPVKVVSDYSVPTGTTIILALGKDSLVPLQDAKIVAKNRSVVSYRTMPLNYYGTPVLVSYSHDIGEIDHGQHVDLITDVNLAIRFALTGKWTPAVGDYHYVQDFTILCALIEEMHTVSGQPVDITLDLETRGKNPYALPSPGLPGGYIVTIQGTCQKGKAWVIRFCNQLQEEARLQDPLLRSQLDFLLNCPYIRLKGADFKYDMGWFWVRGQFTSTSFTFDTTLVGSLLDENRSNSLDLHVKHYVPAMAGYSDKFDNEVDKNRMDLVPPEQLLPYAGGDVDGDLQVAEVEKKELLKDAKLANFYINILHPAARAFEQIQQTGILIDQDAYAALKSELEQEQIRLITEAKKIMGGRIFAKHMDLSRPGGMNLTKASMLKDFMFSPLGLNLKPKEFTPKPDKDGILKPATSLEHLSMFAEVPEAKEFVSIYSEYSSVVKTYNTYVIGFLEHLRSDGRYHPNFFMFVGNKQRDDDGGANSGRLSCKYPAFQTIPKHTKWAKKIRRCFRAPDGYVIAEIDYSQGELRVIACIADEDNMIAVYKAGRDLHVETSAAFSGHTYESLSALEEINEHEFSEIRQLGKAGNFGLVFKMSVGEIEDNSGFIGYAKNNYGVNLTKEEATKFHTGFFDKYPKLLNYHEHSIMLAHRDKQVRSPLGRVRHLPLIDSPFKKVSSKAERQAINSPVQGTLTDMVLWALSIHNKTGLQSIAPVFGACHDATYSYVPEDQVDEIVTTQLNVMENLPFEIVNWKPQLKFLADAKVGQNMGDMVRWKKPK